MDLPVCRSPIQGGQVQAYTGLWSSPLQFVDWFRKKQSCPYYLPRIADSAVSSQITKKSIRIRNSEYLKGIFVRNVESDSLSTLALRVMHASPQVITSAMQLYFTGESFRNVKKFLTLQGVNVSHQTVYNWISKYVSIMEKLR